MSNWTKVTAEERSREMKIKNNLMDKYPLIFHFHRRPGQHSMVYGLEVRIGWIPMLDEMCSKIEKIINDELDKDPNFNYPKAVQVKEKFGGLRFYTSLHGKSEANKQIQEIIASYEEKSYDICEECSKPGTIRTTGWHRVLCDSCEANRK